MSTLGKLVEWYATQCNGDWEHQYGIKIDTLDNPGWSVDINLNDTDLEERHFKQIQIDRSDDDWVFCRIENGTFRGTGGIRNLSEIIDQFNEWSDMPN